MPQKLNVGESLAFLIACIEASGKLDYKRLGDNLEIQPAAARMRLTRLRRAVANREFEDAILVQPGKLDPEIAALANPESRKLTEAADKARQTRKADKLAGKSELSAELVLDSDSELDDELDGEVDDDPHNKKETWREPNSASTIKRSKKRKASVDPLDESDGDENLFFKDTSSASRKAKHIKLEDDDTNMKAEEPIREREMKVQAKDAIKCAPMPANASLLGSGGDTAGRSVAESHNVAAPRVLHPMGGSPVLVNQNRLPIQSTLPPQEWYQIQRELHAKMIRRTIPNAAREAVLAQTALQPHQLVRNGAVHTTNGQRAGPVQNRSPSTSIAAQHRPSNSPPADDPKINLSSPAAVFSHFRRPTPPAHVAANPATKRVIIPKDQRALLPGLQVTSLHSMNSPSGGLNTRLHSELMCDRTPVKRMAIRSTESDLPAERVEEMKEEDEDQDGLAQTK